MLRAVQVGFCDSHALAVIVGARADLVLRLEHRRLQLLVLRLLFVSGLEKRMPAALGRVNERKVPVYAAVLTQTVLSSIFVVAVFNPCVGGDNTQKAYWLFQAARDRDLVHLDGAAVLRHLPRQARVPGPVRRGAHVAPGAALRAAAWSGCCASAFGAYVTFRSPWTPLFSVGDWRLWLGDPRRRVGARRDRDLRDQPVHPPRASARADRAAADPEPGDVMALAEDAADGRQRGPTRPACASSASCGAATTARCGRRRPSRHGLEGRIARGHRR